MGGVYTGTHKTFACARVPSPRLCAFSSARWFHTKLILGIPPFSVKHDYFYRETTRDTQSKSALEAPVCGEECVPVAAGQQSHCKVSALSDTSLLCAATFTLLLRQLLRCFVCAGSFGIFYIFRIFPLPLCWISRLCLAGRSSFIYPATRVVIAATF